MILKPEQDNEDPSAVRSFTPEVEVEAGAGKTKTEAPESTRNCPDKSLSRRNTREDPVEPAERVKASFCQAASFLTRNTVLYISELCQRDFNDTRRGQANQNHVWQMEGLNSHKNWEKLGRKNRTIFWGGVYMVDGRGVGNLALTDFVGTESQGERV